MRRALAVVAAAAALGGAALAIAEHHGQTPTAPVASGHTQRVVAVASREVAAPTAPVVDRCTAPAPQTASGYAKMFAALSPAQWGAADVSISVPLADGRVLWLYGDTFSTGRFVHSSAIVQDRGCLHVVNGGAQLLPNIDARHIFWIESAEVRPVGVIITARAITLTGTGPWDFKDGGYSQAMTLNLDSAGDAAGEPGWALVSPLGPSLHSPASDPGPMYSFGPHHFGYARHAHPEAALASGRTLVTVCQNWDDGKLHGLADYRPIFSEK